MKSSKLILIVFFTLFISSCSVSTKISKPARKLILENKSFINAHTGISVYEPATNKYWYNYQAEKYFVPASNTKLATCYAAMKYLKDSLVGIRYFINDSSVNIIGTGDPTFLDPEFANQPVFDFLEKFKSVNYLLNGPQRFSSLGDGWSWDDYTGDYAAERSEMPIYDNVARFFIRSDSLEVTPHFFFNSSIAYTNSILRNGAKKSFEITRPLENNSFHTLNSPRMFRSKIDFSSQSIPFKSYSESEILNNRTFIRLLEDTLHKRIGSWSYVDAPPQRGSYSVIHSQPSDSLFKPMMHRSDNFYAEQSLLMVSEKILNYMSDRGVIDTLLNSDYKLMPQKPSWVDGSGLSRYNLFSPKDFVFILNKMKDDFGMERIKNILATGGTGTIKNYYLSDSGFIFAKTGTLNGVVAFSGFLYTKKNKLLIFSILVNNHRTSSANIRKGVEQFIQNLRHKY